MVVYILGETTLYVMYTTNIVAFIFIGTYLINIFTK